MIVRVRGRKQSAKRLVQAPSGQSKGLHQADTLHEGDTFRLGKKVSSDNMMDQWIESCAVRVCRVPCRPAIILPPASCLVGAQWLLTIRRSGGVAVGLSAACQGRYGSLSPFQCRSPHTLLC